MTLSILSENENIVMLEGEGNYTRIHYSCGKATLSSYTLLRFEETLSNFCRVSRKYLLNPRYISKVATIDTNTHVVLSNGLKVKVPRRKAKSFSYL
jgi:DNA-binding LytR/AlgR family response regulator